MAAGSECRSPPVRRRTLVLWLCSALCSTAAAKGEMSHVHSTLSISAPHLFFTCPEGATVKLVCAQRGAALHPTDLLKRSWLFTPHSDQHCSGREGPRHTTFGGHHHGNHSTPPELHFGFSEQNFWVILQNLTHADQGRYCCLVLDVQMINKHPTLVQKPHSHIVLHVTPRRNGSQDCTVWDPTPSGGTVPVALAIAACILALLSLPLILVLVYKQRENTHSSRRAQELVRMDSEAHGHENPVFLGGSPQIKTRTVSQIMARQSSETGRHLLSEPGTPLSPPAHGDMVFFPIEDTIPESPDFLQV
ncbi:V-type immunoglobulin domain-containing suppressor of T-cell activation [Scophthalmus maximus]|uniref:V-type immunoglobulin domain-containing suppressor of T-cell activation n=1 Tax=Scophthalmus maximus TaxID=52904 RepID=UPI001FA9326B|nr:V-type immunoglobulin domain-containing suppressor of T-cell activation [Scophthalmus maximus]